MSLTLSVLRAPRFSLTTLDAASICRILKRLRAKSLDGSAIQLLISTLQEHAADTVYPIPNEGPTINPEVAALARLYMKNVGLSILIQANSRPSSRGVLGAAFAAYIGWLLHFS